MRLKSAVISLLSISALALTGCALQDIAAPSQVTGGVLTGTVHGGQQPISGAHVYVMQASNSGYGTASTSLITAGAGVSNDSVGNYVTTDAGGNFSLTGKYTCVTGAQVYVLAEQGNPGLVAGTNNTHIALMTPLGVCTAAGTFSSSLPTIAINEVTTVASVYALAPYMTSPIAVGSSATNTGLTYAMLSAYNIVDMVHGLARTTTGGGNGTVPTSTINTLANIIAACINTDGTVSGPSNPTPCYTLFKAVNAGVTAPNDTVTALLDIARFPAQAVDLGGGFTMNDSFTLSSATAPFQPSLSTRPNDWTLEVSYGLNGLNGTVTSPRKVAIDAGGNVWTVNGNNTISSFDPLGVPLGNFSGNGLSNPTAIAVDQFARVWVTNAGTLPGGGSVSVFNAGDGSAATLGSPITGVISPADIAFDRTGSAWMPNNFTSTLMKVATTGGAASSFSGNGLAVPDGVAVGSGVSGNVWVANQNSNVVSAFTTAGAAVAGSPFATGDSGAYVSDAIDATGNIWITNSVGGAGQGITKMSNAGVVASGSPYSSAQVNHSLSVAIGGLSNVWVSNTAGTPIEVFNNNGTVYGSALAGLVTDVSPTSLAIDASGNVWFRNSTDATLRELIGAANPIATPIAAQVSNNNLGTRP